jgi:hypothetical protein
MVRKKDSGKAAVPKAPAKPNPWDDPLGALLLEHPELTADDVRGLTMDQVRQLLVFHRATTDQMRQLQVLHPAQPKTEEPQARILARQLRQTGLTWKAIQKKLKADLGVARGIETIRGWSKRSK